MKILLISDIHGNYPALKAVDRQTRAENFDLIINAGDTLVYAPFPNETLEWLREKKAISILGNTDIKVLKLLKGKTFKKPRKPEKRIMYTRTADQLTSENKRYLATLGHHKQLELNSYRVCLYHGSPENPDEHLFQDTPTTRFQELAGKTNCNIIITGHSHSPFHNKIDNVHFINPGSVGRMFDSNPEASYAILELEKKEVKVEHFRCSYDVEAVIEGIKDNLLPQIYLKMFRQGRKLN